MLLHAAERAAPDQPAIEHIVLARETAATNLADTRRFIRELSPAPLTDRSLAAALHRLAATQWRSETLEVQVRVSDSLELPMQVQAALLRIAQGAMANVLQHADARHATISITRDAQTVELVIEDDGEGFDAARVHADREAGASDSFGLTAIRERVDQLGGTLAIETSPGSGTRVTVVLAIEEPA
jgi:signal transduction histidine kinase